MSVVLTEEESSQNEIVNLREVFKILTKLYERECAKVYNLRIELERMKDTSVTTVVGTNMEKEQLSFMGPKDL